MSRRWIITFGGSGFSPFASGTAGSFAAGLVLYGLYLSLPPFLWQPTLVAGTLLFTALTVLLGPWAIRQYNDPDPSPVVIDEVAGMCLTALWLPMGSATHAAITLGLAFFAFRFFDVTKPPPARQLEHLPAGWGIALDDLAAAVYANLLCQLILRYFLTR